MHKKPYYFFVLVCLFLISPTWAQQGSQTIQVTDIVRLQSIGNIQAAPNGSPQALFDVNSIKPKKGSEGDYDYESQVWLATVDATPSIRQLTYADGRKNVIGFSPDGQQVLYLQPVEGKSQLFGLPLNGGEAKQLTHFSYGIGNPIWSPDGKKVLFSVSMGLNELITDSVLNPKKLLPAWENEKPGFGDHAYLKSAGAKANPDGSMEEIRAYLNKNEKDRKAKVINKLQFQGEASTSSDMRFSHFFVWEYGSDQAPVPLTSGFDSYRNAYFIDNGHILLNASLDKDLHPDRVQENEVYKLSLADQKLEKLYGENGKSFSVVSISPDGKYMVLQESLAATPNVPNYRLIELKSGQTKLDFEQDRNLRNFKWTEKADVLYFAKQANGGTFLCRLLVPSGKIEVLSKEDEGIGSYDLVGGKILYAHTTVLNPSELELADLNLKNAKVLSSFNASWLADKKISVPEKHRFKNDEGMDVEYWVMKPTHYEAGKQYPLLLEIHGGPSAMWGPGEAGMWHEYQYFCSQGYGVVYSNPRGSGGYGNAFLRANIENWGEGPTEDVLGALDRTVAEGWADTSKLLITGGSYAGYLVSWIVGHDQRFKAACSQRGVYDLKTFFGEGNAWRLVPNYFGGYPWEADRQPIIERESPINYVANIRTPLIIFHGENDLRTGVIQSEMLYKSLKVLGRPVEYVRHPGATHEITRSGDNRQRIDQMLRTYEFFERFIH